MATDGKISLAVLAGDGIGPKITEAPVRVLRAAAERTGLAVVLTAYPIGWEAYEKSQSTLAPETGAALRSHAGWILGPTFAGEYPKNDPIKGHPSGYLRRNFSLFANVRPVQAWPQLDPLIPDLDITILRENTEGFYPDRNLAWGYGEFMPTADVGLSLRVITAPACDRFARFAFEYAAAAHINRLAVIHKRTALPQTEGLFIGAFERLHPEYQKIQLELVRIDTFSSSFPRDPHRYRLVATTNLFGDTLSDQASGLAGGVGIAPSLNADGEHAIPQAVHGTAPDIAGRGIANPSALILSTALLLNWFYQKTRIEACRETARLLDLGIRNAIASGASTPDLGGNASTDAFATAVIAALEAA